MEEIKEIKLSTGLLTTGLYIKMPCSWSHHPFLFSSFKIQNESQIRVLQSLSVKYVLFCPEKSDGVPLPSNDNRIQRKKEKKCDDLQALWTEKEQRIDEQQRYRRKLRKSEYEFTKSLSMVRSINLKIEKKAQEAFIDATGLMDSIRDKLKADDNTVLHLMEEGKPGHQYHNHALNVSIISMILGKALELSDQELTYLGLGGVFHDIGKSHVPKQILRNNPKIKPAERTYYKMHVRFALEKVENIHNFPPPVFEIIGQHHEYLDGKGYPKQLKGDQISLLSQIVTIADIYDNLCNPVDKHPARTPYHALAHLYRNKGKKLSTAVLGGLIKTLGIYPPGSIVQLSNKKYALVMGVSSDNILQPNVLIYDPLIPKNSAPIITLSEVKLKIEKVVFPSKLPREIAEYLNPRTQISYYFEYANEEVN